MPELVVVVGQYGDAVRAEASRERLASEAIPSFVLPKVSGWLGRALGRQDLYNLGVYPADLDRARDLLGGRV